MHYNQTYLHNKRGSNEDIEVLYLRFLCNNWQCFKTGSWSLGLLRSYCSNSRCLATFLIVLLTWKTPWGFLETQPTNWIGLRSVLRPRQHSIGYMGDGFTGQKTQPTVSKYWRKIYKGKAHRTQRKHKIHICTHTQNSRQIPHTSITQQVP